MIANNPWLTVVIGFDILLLGLAMAKLIAGALGPVSIALMEAAA